MLFPLDDIPSGCLCKTLYLNVIDIFLSVFLLLCTQMLPYGLFIIIYCKCNLAFKTLGVLNSL